MKLAVQFLAICGWVVGTGVYEFTFSDLSEVAGT